ncbi:arsinothricin resistance N-acetyltransferase ArsN1 [Cytobacillus solani]|uniref:GCN5 family acetyltransferase n=2 Tax=Cytobacillus solani TaxID=1637975 RepID=A0A0Q3TDE7_9BACI|nr:arsinothricin resistance N-acetyltransferase ArsN1 family A [Cytobacillus solani]KOP79948.1 GCN5 family acetyltransferase [Bacillus sp. FJAT-21945]KQL21165.1 GCN5 family acetyltransferase [Cytobacillus solani]USK54471.1 arsinothricin resistance N-acetyltransferase ArsN1 [Cytobacillus solani]
MMTIVREATSTDLLSIVSIYNEGIEDRIATLETETKDLPYMQEWFDKHKNRYKVLVAEYEGNIIGWSSLNQYNNRCAYAGVADLSVYVARTFRGKGIGNMLLTAIEKCAKENHFHKIVLFTFPFNQLGQSLYQKKGYLEVGVFKNQGILDGKYVDVMAMEKLLK